MSKNVKTKQSYENFRSAKKDENPYFHPHSFNDPDDESLIGLGNMRSMTNLKSSSHQKRTGILKFNTNFYNSNNTSALGIDEKESTPNSTSSMNLNNESGYPDSHHKTSKRQVKLIDPKLNLGNVFSDSSKSPYRRDDRNEEMSPGIFIAK